MSATQAQATPEALDQGLELVVPGRVESAGQGWTWIAEGWKLFAKAPLMWIVGIVILFVITIMLSLVPILGAVAVQVLQSVLLGGFVAACRSLETGGEFELEHLFAGFTRRFVPLAILGVLLMVGMLAIMLVFAVFAGFSILGALVSGDPETAVAAMAASAGMLVLGVLVMLGLMVPLVAAYWFAPALVMIHGMKPLEAMKASFFASFRNFVPFLVYGLIMLVAGIIAVIPFGLGLLVWIPLAIASTYVAYRRIFTQEATASAPLPASGMVS